MIGSLRALKPIKALVIGDLVLDTYVKGAVGRISPEAPVPVLHATSMQSCPGMAGNVALNLVSLGAKVSLIGRVGEDLEGEKFISILKDEKISCRYVVKQKGYKTPIKQRMIASSQQLLRVDYETVTQLEDSLEKKLISSLEKLIPNSDIIAISDYLKGFLTPTFLEAIISIAKKSNVPVIVDPKGKDFSKYEQATLIKPNQSEAYLASSQDKEASLDEVAKELLKASKAKHLLITRSSKGMSLFSKKSREDFPVESREVIDVTGAGDTVLAMLTMALGNKLEVTEATQLANIAASVAIKRLGCVRVDLSDVSEILLDLHTENKIFDEDHLFALSNVLLEKEYTILALSQRQELNLKLFESLKKLANSNVDHKLIVYVEKADENASFISVLASLHEVDFIILKSHSLEELYKTIHPQKAYSMLDDELVSIKDPKDLLAEMHQLVANS